MDLEKELRDMNGKINKLNINFRLKESENCNKLEKLFEESKFLVNQMKY